MSKRKSSTSAAAQPDSALLAPEYDRAGEAPQVVESDGTYPEVRYQDQPPEVVSTNDVKPEYYPSDKPTSDPVPTEDPVSIKKPLRKKKRWLLIIAAVFLIIAIAVGVGVGVGVGKRHKDKASSTNNSSPDSQSAGSKYAILNDTSLASVTTANGDRRIFFQDKNNTLRQAVWHNNAWLAPTSYVITDGAKANTPLAAMLFSEEQLGAEVIVLYYIATNDTILVQAFAGGSWYDPGEQYGNYTLETKPGSRYLSAASTPGRVEDSYGMLVVFEDKDGSVNAQHATDGVDDGGNSVMLWDNVTSNLTSVNASSTFSAPFTITTIAPGGDAQLACLFRDSKGPAEDYRQLFLTLNSTNNTFANYESETEAELPDVFNKDNADILGVSTDVDVILGYVYNTTADMVDLGGPYGMVVKDGKLDMFRTFNAGPGTGPQTEFPFTRLATTTPVNSTIFYVYHQMNETHIAEESYDYTIGAWTTVFVTISS